MSEVFKPQELRKGRPHWKEAILFIKLLALFYFKYNLLSVNKAKIAKD